MPETKKLILLTAASILTIAGCKPKDVTRAPAGMSGPVVATGTADIGGPYSLINQDGATVTEADFLGRPQLVYFGFGYCPDICPAALQKLGAVQEKIDPNGDKLNYVFITVDPERDTPEALKLYVTANGFPNGLVGLTGSQTQIDTAKSAYKVYAQKAFDPESAGKYTMDHTDIIYLMDAEGEFLDVFTGRSAPDDIAIRAREAL